MKTKLNIITILLVVVSFFSFQAKANHSINGPLGLFKLESTNSQVAKAPFHSAYYAKNFTIYFSNTGVHYVSNTIQGDKLFTNRADIEFKNSSKQLQVIHKVQSNEQPAIRLSVGGGVYRLIAIDTLKYSSIYNKVDLVYFINENQEVSYNYHLKKGANLSDIQLKYSDVFKKKIDERGNLKLLSESGFFSESKPVVYKSHKQSEIESSFYLEGNTLKFNIKKFDNSENYIIDPQINWTSYFGGLGSDVAGDIAIDDSANVYVVGTSLSNNFPTTPGAYQSTRDVAEDAVIAKFDSTGNLIWSTYYGGEAQDEGLSIAVSSSDKVYIAGITRSLILPGTFNNQPGNGSAFVAAFDRNGGLINSRYLGGNSDDESRDIEVIGDTVYITGLTASVNFPRAGIGLTTVKNGGDDVFLTALDDTTGIIWSQYYGGSSGDRSLGLEVDRQNNLILVGETESSDLPMLLASQPTKNALDDAFLAKFSSNGVRLWSTYYGGNDLDRFNSIGTDSANNIYAVGSTGSTDLAFPTGGNTFQDTLAGGLLDIVIQKYDENGSPLWGTYYGGSSSDEGKSIAVNDQGALIITGETESLDLPLSANATQGSKAASIDAFNIQFNAIGERNFATYLGGNQSDFGTAVMFQQDFQNYYIFGNTRSTDFPPIANSFQSTNNGDNDFYIIKSCGLLPNNSVRAAGLDTLILCSNENIPAIIGSVPNSGSGNYTYTYQLLDTTNQVFVDLPNSNSINYTPEDSNLIVGFNTFRRIVDDGVCIDTSGLTVIDYRLAASADFDFSESCRGDLVQFTDLSTVAGNDSVIAWNWFFGDGAVSNLRNPTHRYAVEGTYTVQLDVRTAKGAFNCFGREQKTIVIDSLPTADFTTSSNCNGGPIVFTNTTTNVKDSTVFWDFGDGTTSTVFSPSHEYTNTGTYQVSLIVGSNNVCADTVAKSIVINESPQADFTNTFTTCSDSVITFTDLSTPATDIASWQWSFGDGTNSTDSMPSHTYVNSGNFTVTLVVTLNTGCTDTIFKTLGIGLPPNVDFSASAKCINQETQFTDLSVASFGTVSQWSWDFGDGTTANIQNPVHSYESLGVYTVQLLVATSEGCLNSFSKSIEILPSPTVTASEDVTIIEGESEQISATASTSGSFNWTSSTGISPINIRNPIVRPLSTTIYYVEFRNQDECVATDSLILNVLPDFLIPTAFTPDGDGANDVFEIEGIDRFPGHEVLIFNRWGAQLFEANGNYQNNPWDGTYDGEQVAMGAYYYVVDLKNGESLLKGTITVLK